MLQALLFILKNTGSALGIFLNLDIFLTDQLSFKMRDIVIFLFLLPMFIRLLYVVLNQSVEVSNHGRH